VPRGDLRAAARIAALFRQGRARSSWPHCVRITIARWSGPRGRRAGMRPSPPPRAARPGEARCSRQRASPCSGRAEPTRFLVW